MSQIVKISMFHEIMEKLFLEVLITIFYGYVFAYILNVKNNIHFFEVLKLFKFGL